MADCEDDMEDFTSASRRTLKFLHEQFGLDLWMITRVENDNWIVLSAEDHKYGVREGAALKLSETLCGPMIAGVAPNFAPDVEQIPPYRDAPVAARMTIGSYIGIPIKQPDGSLFGTLCAVGADKHSGEMEKQMGFIGVIGDLLSCLLAAELKADSALRRFERAADSARMDYLTSVYNRRGWAEYLKLEEDRCRRYGNPACVISIDLDGLKPINDREGHARGDAHLRAAAAAIASAVRGSDIVARTGGDEFAVLCVECDPSDAREIANRIRAAMAEKNISASIGMAPRRPDAGLENAMEAADQCMYEDKRRRKGVSNPQKGAYAGALH